MSLQNEKKKIYKFLKSQFQFFLKVLRIFFNSYKKLKFNEIYDINATTLYKSLPHGHYGLKYYEKYYIIIRVWKVIIHRMRLFRTSEASEKSRMR